MNNTLAVLTSGEASPGEVVQATGTFGLIAALIAIPALGAVILLLAGRRANKWGHLLGTAMVLAAFVVACVLFAALLAQPEDARTINQFLWNWIDVGTFKAPFALQLDPLSMCFVLLITGVGSLIHIYSISYMEHDPERRKFFAYLNLFIAAMLLLVLANNYLLLYVGWEGVGLASYLLIGFWFYKPSAATASKKAFVVNRVGDFGLSLAIMMMFATLGTFTFEGVNATIGQADSNMVTWIGLALLLAACGKSAQFPLQSWLLDAMEGPTPVSALIHAATMVTAGVYLIVRSAEIFNLSETARLAVVIVGTITLLMGAVIGSAKDDIKKGLAGSTMSQIGYMFLAAGLGPVGYVFAIFHLLTHGIFKALLFLGRRLGDARHGRPGEHAPLRRTAHVHGPHLGRVRHRLPGDHRRPAVRRVLQQGRDHPRGVGRAPGLRAGGAHRRGRHRLLHDPHDGHDLLRQGPLGGRRAPARVVASG